MVRWKGGPVKWETYAVPTRSANKQRAVKWNTNEQLQTSRTVKATDMYWHPSESTEKSAARKSHMKMLTQPLRWFSHSFCIQWWCLTHIPLRGGDSNHWSTSVCSAHSTLHSTSGPKLFGCKATRKFPLQSSPKENMVSPLNSCNSPLNFCKVVREERPQPTLCRKRVGSGGTSTE